MDFFGHCLPRARLHGISLATWDHDSKDFRGLPGMELGIFKVANPQVRADNSQQRNHCQEDYVMDYVNPSIHLFVIRFVHLIAASVVPRLYTLPVSAIRQLGLLPLLMHSAHFLSGRLLDARQNMFSVRTSLYMHQTVPQFAQNILELMPVGKINDLLDHVICYSLGWVARVVRHCGFKYVGSRGPAGAGAVPHHIDL